MCRILLSINPEYVEQIINKEKIYEFRKIRCKKDIDNIVIYATAPVGKVVAEAEVVDVLEDIPETLWEKTKDFSGITQEFFMDYYKNKEIAIAYKLGKIKKYKTPKSLKDFGVKIAPQSFVYL